MTINQAKRLIVVLVAGAIISCNENDLSNTCGVSNPVEELGWLKEQIQEYEESDSDLIKYNYILQGSYEGETVFILENCCPNCNTVVPVKSCSGETIGRLGYRDEGIDPGTFEDAAIIWSPEDFACELQ